MSLHAVGVNVIFPNNANPISVSLREGPFRATFEIEARRDGQFSGSGDLQFQLSLRNTMRGAVYFTQQNATVTILDADGKQISLFYALLDRLHVHTCTCTHTCHVHVHVHGLGLVMGTSDYMYLSS